MLTYERRHRLRNSGYPQAQGVEAVPSMVVTVPRVDGVAGGELRSGRWPSGRVGSCLRWFLIGIEQGDGFTRGREGFW